MRTETLLKVVVPVVNKLEMEGLLAEGTTNVEVLLCGMRRPCINFQEM